MVIESMSISFVPSQEGSTRYQPGETLHGIMTVVIGGSKPHKISSLLVKVRGLARTKWKASTSVNGNHTVRTRSEEFWLVRDDIYFIEGPTVKALDPGTYQYPFSHTLRRNLPPTLRARHGSITYECKARAISCDGFAANGKTEHAFKVLARRDLNEQPQLAEPLTVTREAEQSLFGHAIGQYRLTMSAQAVTGGQNIRITIDGPERLFKKLAKADGVVKLKRLVTFIAQNTQCEVKENICEVYPNRTRTGFHQVELTVPPQEGVTISPQMCRIINVSHYIKISTRHINLHLPMVIGTVPFSCSPPRSVSPWPHAAPQAWAASPRASPAHRRDGQFAPSAPAACALPAASAASVYDPPPSYEQVMRDQQDGDQAAADTFAEPR